jgi:hypothetical protein
MVPADTIGLVIDSIARARTDTSRKPALPGATGQLTVRSADGASLSVNGIDVGLSTWSSDTMRAGIPLVVRASVSAPEGCPTAFASSTVRLRAGAREQVSLPVRSCGVLRIALRNQPHPEGTRFTLAGDGVSREGDLPMGAGQLLPVGLYQLRISAPGCQDFETSIQLSTGSLDRSAVLDCSAASR